MYRAGDIFLEWTVGRKRKPYSHHLRFLGKGRLARDNRTPPTKFVFYGELGASFRSQPLRFLNEQLPRSENVRTYDNLYLKRKKYKVMTRMLMMHLYREVSGE